MAKKKKKPAPAKKSATKDKRAALTARGATSRKPATGKTSARKTAASKAATRTPARGGTAKPTAASRATAPAARKKAAAQPKRAAPKRKAARHQAGREAAHLERNKQLVLAMYQKLIGEKDFEAASPYLGATYRQHAPYAADGHEGVRAWLEAFKAAFPGHSYEVKKVLADGDMVVLHLHGKGGPNPYGESVVDFFRLDDNGKIVEHWDVIQPIPDTADNANSMF